MKYTGCMLYLLVVVFLLSGCLPKTPHTLVPDYQSRTPLSIAVLPVQNETVDLDAPKAFRPKILNAIQNKGYLSPPTTGIDHTLAQKDIKEAGQLGALTPQEIGTCLNVDALLYSTVTTWNTKYLVVYSSINVGARFQLIDAKTGQQLWESKREVSEKRFGADEEQMKGNLAFALLKRYEPYIDKVINSTLSTLPNGPNYVQDKKGSCLGP